MGEIKVTDKRMFTADGRLREEFEDLESVEATAGAPAPEPPAAASAAAPAPSPAGYPAPSGESPETAESNARGPALEIPGTPPGLGPTFYDLVAVLAEPASLYLGDLQLPDGSSAENLEMARLHIDLLDLLRQRTAGHLSAQERAVLEDVLYRLRLRYVQKRG